MPIRHQTIRNTVARSPLLRKGGVHQKARSAERQRQRLQVEDAVDEWLEEQDSRREKPPDASLGLERI